jgi:hypothetical protein
MAWKENERIDESSLLNTWRKNIIDGVHCNHCSPEGSMM